MSYMFSAIQSSGLFDDQGFSIFNRLNADFPTVAFDFKILYIFCRENPYREVPLRLKFHSMLESSLERRLDRKH